MAQLTGIVIIRANGTELQSKEGAKLILGGMERTPQVGSRVYGYTEKVIPATVDCTIVHGADTDLIALRDFKDGTIEFECDSGKTYLVNRAFLNKPPELTAGGADVALSFTGDPAVEI